MKKLSNVVKKNNGIFLTDSADNEIQKAGEIIDNFQKFIANSVELNIKGIALCLQDIIKNNNGKLDVILRDPYVETGAPVYSKYGEATASINLIYLSDKYKIEEVNDTYNSKQTKGKLSIFGDDFEEDIIGGVDSNKGKVVGFLGLVGTEESGTDWTGDLIPIYQKDGVIDTTEISEFWNYGTSEDKYYFTKSLYNTLKKARNFVLGDTTLSEVNKKSDYGFDEYYINGNNITPEIIEENKILLD